MKCIKYDFERLKQELSNDENVLLAYIFGSVARGLITPLSDVDIAVLLKDSCLKELGKLWSNIAKALRVSEDKVDLVDLSQAPITLKCSIVKHGFKLVDKGDYEESLKKELVSKYLEAKFLLDSTYSEAVRTLSCEVDKNLLKLRIFEALERIATLREEVLSKPKEQVIASRVYKGLMERCVHIIIEAMLDVCRHIVSAKKLGIPETYGDLVRLLREGGILLPDLAERIEDLVMLRNVLVHRYIIISHEKLYEESKALIRVIEEFIGIVESLIKEGC